MEMNLMGFTDYGYNDDKFSGRERETQPTNLDYRVTMLSYAVGVGHPSNRSPSPKWLLQRDDGNRRLL